MLHKAKFLSNLVAQSERASAPVGFRLGDIVGVGGMGVVYRLHSLTRPDEDQVIKFVHPLFSAYEEANQKLRYEAEIEISLRGLPHVVQTLTHGVNQKGQQYKIMQRFQGESMKAWLQRGPLQADMAKVLNVLRKTLASIHDRGITHGDLKLSNLYIAPDCSLTLFDFGLADNHIENIKQDKENFAKIEIALRGF